MDLGGPAAEVLSALPARRGHFLLESGYHADTWLTLDALFVEPQTVAPLVARLGERLRRHDVSAICGPLMGGAFLAQALATRLGVRFYHTVPAPVHGSVLFTAEYHLPPALAPTLRGARVAVVDDVISAGSSVRATMAALADAGATTAVAAAFLVLGNTGADYCASQHVPLEALDRRPFAHWPPAECPLCARAVPLEDPRE